MTTLKDSPHSSIAEHSLDLRMNQKNFKTLAPEETRKHLTTLAHMLALMTKLIRQKLPNDGGNNPDFLLYLNKLRNTLDAIVLKNRLESMKANSDIRLSCSIDPSDSGFPIFLRDFKFLTTDKDNAEAELRKIPNDARLVDDALFILFRGHFPRNVVLQKLTRNYYATLAGLVMPESLQIYPEKQIKEDEGMHFCKQSFERLDEHHNLPRFYTLYLKIPAKTYPRAEWRQEIRQAIQEGLSTVVNLELKYLADKVEALEGVQLEYIERFDVGPFYSALTENGDTVRALIEAESDCIMMFSKSIVVRAGEEERVGLGERLKGWRSGDTHIGAFSPMIESPQYILMPHRLIQKVHNLNITLKEHTQMFGITGTGDFNA